MSILTVLMLIGLNGYLLYRAWQARKPIWRGGPAMWAGVALLLAVIVCGQLRSLGFLNFTYFFEIVFTCAVLGFISIAYAVIVRGFR
jgi:hypothetical protein